MRAQPADHSQSSSPDWWKHGVVYQIYPRSFADTTGDGLGDLPGILAHLDQLNDGTHDSLGIDALWLSPIYPSPDFDFGYDVADYVGVDPRFGTLADFTRLVNASHERGVRVILDLVLNHTSHLHPWFVESRASRTGQHADWFIWRDSPGRTITGKRRLPNNWRSYFGGPAWTWDEARGQFYLHTFLPEQPDLNWRNAETRAALIDVVRTWLDRGVDGCRLDVFNVYFKDEQLRSNPLRIGRRGWWSWQRHVHDRDQPELSGVLAELRSLVDERPGRMTIGELFDGNFLDAAAHTAPRHLIFDWALIGRPWAAAAFRASIAARERAFGPDRWPANVLSNHDQPRHASRYDAGRAGDRRVGDARAKVLATMLITLRGTPFLYYGEELAVRNLVIPNAVASDPPARRSSLLSPWWNRDQARGPMPWRPGPGGGFTTGTPWLPLPADADARNVERQAGDPESVLSLYRRLVALRHELAALHAGTQELLDVGDPDVLAYRRTAVGQSAVVLLNFGSRESTAQLPDAAPGGAAVFAASGRRGAWQVALSTHGRKRGEQLTGPVILAPLEALIAYD